MMKRTTSRHGFMLFEVMIAVTIFALGVIGLGVCMNNCLRADQFKEEEARARRLLENRMAEILAGTIPATDKSVEEFKDAFAGMKLKTTRLPLKLKNEDGIDIVGLFAITLEAQWVSEGEEQARDLSFYVYPRQR